ncbi:MAG: hypothetical protein JSR73_19650 [Proteobacteria bacterium]|nr:hypothetical protein [Pseudomonadota bacterium]
MKPLENLTRFATVRILTETPLGPGSPAGAAADVEPSPRPAGWDPFVGLGLRDAVPDPDGPSRG